MKITDLTVDSFSKYGVILPSANVDGVRFDVKLTEPSSTGWRIAVLAVESKTINELHCHPETMESFEVLHGSVILLVASPDQPDDVSAFYLDKAVCVNKGVWHGTITLSDRSFVRITENSIVSKKTHAIQELGVSITQ